MKIFPIESRWDDVIDPSWIESLDATGLLRRAREGLASETELQSFVIQQQHYSRHFTRYLCALIANLHDDGDRRELTENLFEEMGLGGMGNIPHSQIYLRMMQEMGIVAGSEEPLPETRELVRLMLSSCANEDAIVGLAALCLGAEAIVPHVYSQIVTGFEAIGTPAERLEFFTLHIEGDDEHAVTLRKIIDRELARSPHKLGLLRETARQLIAARTRFFAAISERAVTGLTQSAPEVRHAAAV
jgi:pyrroloquinoline quinone (PQQ) biosynthesis protein C